MRGKLFERRGISEAVTQCDCCGRADLHTTVVLLHLPTGTVCYFGRECAEGAVHPWAGLSPKYSHWAGAAGNSEGEE